MTVKPTLDDVKLVLSYTGKVVIGVAILLVIPMLTACGAEACALELGALGEHAHIRESVFADALGIGFVLCEEREVLR